MTIRAGEVFRVRVEVYTAATSVAIAKLKTDQILVVDRDGPLRDTAAPGKPQKFKGEVYTLPEIMRIGEAIGNVDMKAFAIICVAAFAGLRLAELRGLRWGDYDGESLTIRRAVWRTHVGDTKNTASAASVPVLPVLKKVLDEYQSRVNASGKFCSADDYIFAGERRGAPLNLANLARRVIVPNLIDTAADNEGPAVNWKGWHAFRRA